MGTLHSVYQLQSRVLNSGAILRVRKDKESLFSEKYTIINQTNDDGTFGIFSNTFIINARDGKVRRYSVYAAERIIDCKEPGIYVCIQSGSKYGFDDNFNAFLKEMAPYLEDSLYYVIWDDEMNRYEITNGELSFKNTTDFDRWNYDFGAYLQANYSDSEQLIADYYVEEANEMILRHHDMIKNGEDPKGLYYEIEDYEDLFHKISNYESCIETEKFKQLTDWFNAQIYDTICVELVVTASQSIYDENEVYMQGKFEIRVNTEKPYAESDIIDISEFLKSMQQDGEYFIFSCCCGVPSCSGWAKGIQVEHFDTTFKWTNLNTGKTWYFEKHSIEDDIKTIREEDKVYKTFFAKKEIEYIGVGDYWNTDDKSKN